MLKALRSVKTWPSASHLPRLRRDQVLLRMPRHPPPSIAQTFQIFEKPGIRDRDGFAAMDFDLARGAKAGHGHGHGHPVIRETVGFPAFKIRSSVDHPAGSGSSTWP